MVIPRIFSHINPEQLIKFRKIILLICFIWACGYYILHPQAFLDLWLTRDQQASLTFDRGQYGEAANIFLDQRWRAYSKYAAGEFDSAVGIYRSLPEASDRFAQANAHAHAGDYYEARTIYQEILALDPSHEGAQFNLSMMQFIIRQAENLMRLKVTVEKAMEGSDDMLDIKDKIKKNKKKRKEETNQTADERPDNLTDEIWLEQVQKNPVFFLRKKFNLQYVAEQADESSSSEGSQ